MSSLRSEIVRLAYAKPHLRGALLPVLVRLAKEFNTDKELEQYLEDHPDADPKNHTVKKPEGEDKSKEDEKAKDTSQKGKDTAAEVESKLPGADLTEQVGRELAEASPEARAVITDPKVREKVMDASAADLRKERDAGVAQAAQEAADDVDLGAAEEAYDKAKRGEKLTDEEVSLVGMGVAAITQSVVNMGVAAAKKAQKGAAYAKAFLYRLYESFFEFIINELSKVDGLQNISDLTTKNDKFRKLFRLQTPEEIRAQHEKWDAVADQHGLESEDIDKIQEAQRKALGFLSSEGKRKAPEEEWDAVREYIKKNYGQDKALMKRLNELDAADYREISRVLAGEESNKNHKPSKTIREEAGAAPAPAAGAKKKEKAKSKSTPSKAEATAKIEAAKKQYSLTSDEIDSMRDYASSTGTESQTQKAEKTDAQLMQEFLAKASPETKKRLRGMPPSKFMEIIGAMLDEEEATAAGKTAAVKPGIAFAADIYDRVTDLFDKGLTQEQVSEMMSGKKAALRATTIRLAYAKPHLRGHLLPLVTR